MCVQKLWLFYSEGASAHAREASRKTVDELYYSQIASVSERIPGKDAILPRSTKPALLGMIGYNVKCQGCTISVAARCFRIWDWDSFCVIYCKFGQRVMLKLGSIS